MHLGDVANLILAAVVLLAIYFLVVFILSFRQGMARAGTAESALIKGSDGSYTSASKAVRCPHCSNDSFSERQSQLNTWFLSMISLEWMNRDATALICRKCGHVMWFSQKPTKAPHNA